MRAITFNNKNIYDTYLEIGLIEYLNKEKQTKQCPSPDCPNRFIPDPACREKFDCEGCKNEYCSYCLFNHNLAITCEQARIERDPDLANEIAFLEWASENSMQCASCGNAVERNDGCNHMTCKCGYEFCYVCGKQWGNITCPYYNHPPV